MKKIQNKEGIRSNASNYFSCGYTRCMPNKFMYIINFFYDGSVASDVIKSNYKISSRRASKIWNARPLQMVSVWARIVMLVCCSIFNLKTSLPEME
jgi:hypothetical protein